MVSVSRSGSICTHFAANAPEDGENHPANRQERRDYSERREQITLKSTAITTSTVSIR